MRGRTRTAHSGRGVAAGFGLIAAVFALAGTAGAAPGGKPGNATETASPNTRVYLNKRDLVGDFVWEYYFSDSDATQIARFAIELSRLGYRFVELRQPVETQPEGMYVLRVQRSEHHTLDSLQERNLQLRRLAQDHSISSFDGMGVADANFVR